VLVKIPVSAANVLQAVVMPIEVEVNIIFLHKCKKNQRRET
jgi:hypothetical protein